MDGQNRRVGRKVNGVLAQGFLYETSLSPVAELDGSGNLVSQMLSDYQGYANGGNGYIRILTIDFDNNQFKVSTYSPYLNQSMADATNQFTLPYK